jgi:hypothetical protein
VNQDHLIVLLFRVMLIVDETVIIAFIVQYTVLAPWWKNAIGRTIVIKDMLLALAFVPSLLSLFINFSRLTSRVAAWLDLAMFAGIAVAMAWRIVVWNRIQRQKADKDAGQGDGG